MEILQDKMEKMELSSERFGKFFLVFTIALPLLLLVAIICQNSSFDYFESYIQDKTLGGIAQNNVTEKLDATDENIPMSRVSKRHIFSI